MIMAKNPRPGRKLGALLDKPEHTQETEIRPLADALQLVQWS